MKKLRNAAALLLILGLALKFKHYPGGSVSLIIGAFSLGVFGFIEFGRNLNKNLSLSFLNLSMGILCISLLFRVQFYPGALTLFYVGLLSSIAWLILMVGNQVKPKIRDGIMLVFVGFCIWLSFVPTHKVHYFVSMTEFLNSEYRDKDYWGWDKQSWFLYLDEKYEEAEEANNKALRAIELHKNGIPFSEPEMEVMINLHGEKIKSRTWDTF